MNSENNVITVKTNRSYSFPKMCFITLMIVSALFIGSFEIFGNHALITDFLGYVVVAVPFIAGIPGTIALFKRAK